MCTYILKGLIVLNKNMYDIASSSLYFFREIHFLSLTSDQDKIFFLWKLMVWGVIICNLYNIIIIINNFKMGFN